MSVELRDGSVVEDPRLGRIPQWDEQSRQFPARALLSSEQKAKGPRSYTWRVNCWLDQGAQGSCVGHGFAHELAARPQVVRGMTHDHAVDFYFSAQRIDEWEGGSYPGASPFYEGTSVLAGAKVLTSRGYYSAYHWVFSEPELAMAVGYKGPVVMGTWWYDGMFNSDENGYIRPTGRKAGGHCYLAYRIDLKNDEYWIWNSWGRDWGVNGTARLKRADMARLLAEEGEGCVPVRQKARL
jgi:hypothetical protein